MSYGTEILVDYLLILIGFVIFMFIQAIFINGWHDLFSGGCVQDISKGKICDGNLFYKINPSFFEKHRGKTWTKNLWGCVKCESSTIGSITFWIPVIWLFNFNWMEIFFWIIDIISLVYINFYFYKKI